MLKVEQLNMWDEPFTMSTVRFEENSKVLSAATFNKLIEHITGTSEDSEQASKVFLMMYPCFTTGPTVLNKLIERYKVPVAVTEKGMMFALFQTFQSDTLSKTRLLHS